MANFGNEWRDAKFDPKTRRIANTASAGTTAPAKRRSKYNAVRYAADPERLTLFEDGVDLGINPSWPRFDSKREANRYCALMLEQRAGTISGLTLQPRFSLTTQGSDGVRRVVGEYRGDFEYVRDGRVVVEDAKGHRTETYRWKKRHLLFEHGIEVFES